MTDSTPELPLEHRLTLRNLRLADYDNIRHIMDTVYPTMQGAWSREQFASQLARFPEGRVSASRTTAAWSPQRSV